MRKKGEKKLIEITENENGTIWCQIFAKNDGRLISSFWSESEIVVLEKAIGFLKGGAK